MQNEPYFIASFPARPDGFLDCDSPLGDYASSRFYHEGRIYYSDEEGNWYFRNGTAKDFLMYLDAVELSDLEPLSALNADAQTCFHQLQELESQHNGLLACVALAGSEVIFCCASQGADTFFRMPIEGYRALTPPQIEQARNFADPLSAGTAYTVQLLEGNFCAWNW